MTNHERIGKALDPLKAGLGPFVDPEMHGCHEGARGGSGGLRPFVNDPQVRSRPS